MYVKANPFDLVHSCHNSRLLGENLFHMRKKSSRLNCTKKKMKVCHGETLWLQLRLAVKPTILIWWIKYAVIFHNRRKWWEWHLTLRSKARHQLVSHHRLWLKILSNSRKSLLVKIQCCLFNFWRRWWSILLTVSTIRLSKGTFAWWVILSMFYAIWMVAFETTYSSKTILTIHITLSIFTKLSTSSGKTAFRAIIEAFDILTSERHHYRKKHYFGANKRRILVVGCFLRKYLFVFDIDDRLRPQRVSTISFIAMRFSQKHVCEYDRSVELFC